MKLMSPAPMTFCIRTCQDQDDHSPEIRLLANPGKHLQPIGPRQVDIQQHQLRKRELSAIMVRAVPLEITDRLLPIGNDLQLMRGEEPRHRAPQEQGIIGIIFSEEDCPWSHAHTEVLIAEDNHLRVVINLIWVIFSKEICH